MTELERKILYELQADLPLVTEPYAHIAAKLDISEQQLLDSLQGMLDKGTIRRIAAVLNHRRLGYQANALCVWRIPAEDVDEVAALFARLEAVTHCYERITYPEWSYNLYTMLHAETRQECEALIAKMSLLGGVQDYRVFYSLQELKKVTMRYD